MRREAMIKALDGTWRIARGNGRQYNMRFSGDGDPRNDWTLTVDGSVVERILADSNVPQAEIDRAITTLDLGDMS